MSEDSPVEAVALLRVPEWDAPDELDVRFLEDGALVFLPVDFDAHPHDLLEALIDEVGEIADAHDDERGVFFFPDWAEPDEAETYEAVIAAVGDDGKWLAIDAAPPDLAGLIGANAEGVMQQAFEVMGISDPAALMRAMQSGDKEAMKLAQIQMNAKLEEMMRAARGEVPAREESGEDADETKEPKDRS